MKLGLQGMINTMLQACDFAVVEGGHNGSAPHPLARCLSLIENNMQLPPLSFQGSESPVIGITGTGGAGKSTLTDEIVRRFLIDFDDIRIAVLSVDPTRQRTGGALLGDRIRMNALYGDIASDRVYMRSFATRRAHLATSRALQESIQVCRAADFDMVIVETAGIGQSDTEIADMVDVSLYVMTHDFGAPTQLEKIGMLDVADLVVLNKFDRRGSLDALRDVRKQVQRNLAAFATPVEDMPVYPAMASRFNDAAVTRLYLRVLDMLRERQLFLRKSRVVDNETDKTMYPEGMAIIPLDHQRYLGDIVKTHRDYRNWVDAQVDVARQWGQAVGARDQIERWAPEDASLLKKRLGAMERHWWNRLDTRCQSILERWDALSEKYRQETFTYEVREKKIQAPLYHTTLSHLRLPCVALPRTSDPGERLRFALLENLPGYFPFTAGVFPFKRIGEDPTRMFAGEGCPERTNRRFHLVSQSMAARRLSTAFDSVTLYGFDPHERPDVYGKVGNAGVSVCTLDDMKKLYSGFDLTDPATSVSMTINGPAPMILAMFFNAAIDQATEHFLKTNNRWGKRGACDRGKTGDGPSKVRELQSTGTGGYTASLTRWSGAGIIGMLQFRHGAVGCAFP